MAITLKHTKQTADRAASRLRRQKRGRKKLNGTSERPRLVVTRSPKHISVQVVDDLVGKTLAFASTMEADVRSVSGDKTEKAKFYKDAQETIYKDAPWVPLVTEKLLSAKSKKLSGVYTMPDGSFNFTEIDLK